MTPKEKIQTPDNFSWNFFQNDFIWEQKRSSFHHNVHLHKEQTGKIEVQP